MSVSKKDDTVLDLGQVLKKLFNIMFRRRDWEVLVEKTSESSAEHMKRVTGQYYEPKQVGAMLAMTAKTHILILKCKNTGKIKEIVNELKG